MKCYIHPEIDAVATCANCGRAICQTCAVNVAGRLVCQRCVTAGAVPVTHSISASRSQNLLAILSLLVGILGVIGCLCGGVIGGLVFGLPAALFGYLARQSLLRPGNREEGLQLATIGMWLGLAEVGLSVVAFLFLGGAVGLGFLDSWLRQMSR
jgi:hypothetical protein